MNLPMNISAASLPQTYERAKVALSECSKIDECKSWSDKAAALASYAKQADDDELQLMAQRIRARAIRRAGEIMKQIEPRTGNQHTVLKEGDHLKQNRTNAAREAGMSDWQQKTALRVANLSDEEFDRQIESDAPPTVSQLAEQGKKPRKNIVDLKGRDPKEFSMATHYIGGFDYAARSLEKLPHDEAIAILTEEERRDLRDLIQRIDAITDRTITRI